MSSKVLTGEATKPAEPICWKRIASTALNPETGGDSSPESKEAQLEARLGDLNRQMEQREQQAFAAGYRKGEAAGQERLEPIVERLARTLEELAARRRELRREAERDLVMLALAIARRILHREISMDSEAILGVVKAALEKLDEREVDRVRVNPEDAALVARYCDQSRPRRLEVVPDGRLERGSAIFETPRGSLDASVQTQLEEIHRGLVDRLRA